MEIHNKVKDCIDMNKRHKRHNKALMFLALVIAALGFLSLVAPAETDQTYLTTLAVSAANSVNDRDITLSMLPLAFIFSTFIISVLLVYKIKEMVSVPDEKLKKIKPAKRNPYHVKENVLQKLNHWFDKHHK